MSGAGAEHPRDIAESGFRLFNEGRLDEFYETFHPQGVMVTDPGWPGGGRYEGLEAFRRFIDQFLEAFAEVRFEQVREPQRIGEAALFQGHWVGTGASTGIDITSVEFWVVFAARDGLIAECHFLYDDEQALALARALGSV